jgi:hypothetical protein
VQYINPTFKTDLTTPPLESVGVVFDLNIDLNYVLMIEKHVAKNKNDLT